MTAVRPAAADARPSSTGCAARSGDRRARRRRSSRPDGYRPTCSTSSPPWAASGLLPPQPWRPGGVCRRHAGLRGTEPGRCLGGLDRDDRIVRLDVTSPACPAQRSTPSTPTARTSSSAVRSPPRVRGRASTAGTGSRGRWAFASGCEHADWLYGNCIEEIDGGAPDAHGALRRGEVEIEDTWTCPGCAAPAAITSRRGRGGSGRAHCAGHGVDRRAWTARWCGSPCRRLYRAGGRERGPRDRPGAVEDDRRPRSGKVPLLAARTVARTRCSSTSSRRPIPNCAPPAAWCTRMRTTAWATAVPGQSSPLNSAPGSALRRPGRRPGRRRRSTSRITPAAAARSTRPPAAARLRDVHAITQHFLVRPDTLRTAGAVLAGQGLDVPVF